jgi:hypothetical protein
MAQIEKADEANPEAADKAFKINRISAIVMTLAIAGGVVAAASRTGLVFVSYVAMSVYL